MYKDEEEREKERKKSFDQTCFTNEMMNKKQVVFVVFE